MPSWNAITRRAAASSVGTHGLDYGCSLRPCIAWCSRPQRSPTSLDGTLNLAIAILGLALLVLVHELGHFSTARLVGMNPRRFYLGFPPAVFKVTRKGTEYGVGAIPLGGYVKMPGMHRPAASTWTSPSPVRSPRTRACWRRSSA